MKRCLQVSYPDNCEPNEVFPLDDEASAITCFSLLNQMNIEGMSVELITLSDEQWAEAVKAGEEDEGCEDEDGPDLGG